jgi:hypothetical protein
MNKKYHVLCVACGTVFFCKNNIDWFNCLISDIVNAGTHNVPGRKMPTVSCDLFAFYSYLAWFSFCFLLCPRFFHPMCKSVPLSVIWPRHFEIILRTLKLASLIRPSKVRTLPSVSWSRTLCIEGSCCNCDWMHRRPEERMLLPTSFH